MKYQHQTALFLAAMVAAAPAATPEVASATAIPGSVMVSSGPARQEILTATIRAKLDGYRTSLVPAPRPVAATAPGAVVTSPKIIGGAVLSTDLTVGQAGSVPKLRFKFSTDSAGLVGAAFTFTSPSGGQSITVYYYQGPYQTSGTIIFEYPASIPYFAQPGGWTLTNAFIEDFDGNGTSYSPTQLAALFSPAAISVVNTGPVDFVPPKGLFGKVLTPTVSLSGPDPQFRVSIAAEDNLSGVAAGYILIEAPGSTFSQTNITSQPTIFRAGTLKSVASIFPFQPTGTWTITGYVLCDLAGNCFDDQSSVDVEKMFGTVRFNVTQ